MSPETAPSIAPPVRGARFRYEGFDIDPAANRVTCRYSLDGRAFTELIEVPGGGDWSLPAVRGAARLIFLLAGVSYYKTAAPPIIDLGDLALTAAERAFLHDYYVDGLGEFAHENGLDLTAIEIVAPTLDHHDVEPRGITAKRPLIPFGGGLDSIVTVELLRPLDEGSLFVVSHPGDRYDAIEKAIVVADLPVLRAERTLDPQVLRPPADARFFNGHVPITAIISAIAVLGAVLDGRDAVVMSNEWSASSPTIEADGRAINHQWSKSLAFEGAFRSLVSASVAPDLDYFSRLRPHSELWIAQRFAEHEKYHLVFHSCNRAFASDPAKRYDHWCGVCPKCTFIDLIVAPFIPPARLDDIFLSREPLANPSLLAEFEGLIGTTDARKPFECVGEISECRAAVLLAASRDDRANYPLLQTLVAQVTAAGAPADIDALLRPMGPHFVPDRYAADDLLV